VSRRAKAYLVALLITSGAVGWALVRLLSEPAAAPVVATTPTAPSDTAHITATLYYGSSDARALVAVRRDVPAATSVVEQGRQILAVQFQDAPQPYVQVVPTGTKLRAFYVTERGDAFVDLSGDVVSAHPGGSLTELLTVYAVVNAITTNLPAVQRVQILVEGQEVDTIAGHVDVRRPLERDSTLVRDSQTDPKLKAQDSKVK
jgi:spore germination protein GerM